MTNASRSTRTVIEHRFVVPCEEPWGGTWDDFSVARAWAEQKAEALSISTSTADWSRLHVEDDQLVVVLTEVRKGEPGLAEALDAAHSEIVGIVDRAKGDAVSLDSDEYAQMIADAVKKG